MSASTTYERPQYQHYIPRFVLRNFAEKSSPAENNALARQATSNEPTPPQTPTGSRKPRRGRKSRKFPAEDPRNPLVKFYDIPSGMIENRRVARAYGQQDMYRDLQASDVDHIEKQLSVLEQRSARIVHRIKDAQSAGSATVDLTRAERNDIRKFLFIMMYRGPKFRTKYGSTISKYNAEDKADMLRFMAQKGFKSPLEVWFHNLATLLDVIIDVEDRWCKKLLTDMFQPDAWWFIHNMTTFFVCFCEPVAEEDEFIITDNGFGIHEGPTSEMVEIDPETNNPITKNGAYLEYHKIAPFSPKLMLVLRTNLLRKEARQNLETMRTKGQISDKKSIFEYLPVQPPKPSYGSLHSSEFVKKDDDVFNFRISKLSTHYTHLFNTILLEEAREAISWASDKALQGSLSSYLKNEDFLPAPEYYFAGISGPLDRRAKKERLLGLLTCTVKSTDPQNPVLPEVKTKPEFSGYFQLGGREERVRWDTLQAMKIGRMRNHIADILPGGPRFLEYRNAVSRNLMHFLSTIQSPVIFIHIKMWRAGQAHRMSGRTLDQAKLQTDNNGPEDSVAALSEVISEKHRSRLMLEASFKDVHRKSKLQEAALMQIKDQTQVILQAESSTVLQWGGIESCTLLKGTDIYHEASAIVSPYRSTEIEKTCQNRFVTELETRLRLKQSGFIENRICRTEEQRDRTRELLWRFLYWLPDGF